VAGNFFCPASLTEQVHMKSKLTGKTVLSLILIFWGRQFNFTS